MLHMKTCYHLHLWACNVDGANQGVEYRMDCLTRESRTGTGVLPDLFLFRFVEIHNTDLSPKNQRKTLQWLPALLSFSMQLTYTQPFLLQELSVQSVLFRSYSGISLNSFNAHLVKSANSFLKC